VDGVDDLGVVDSLEVDRGDPEVAVTELPLNDDKRHAFASHLDGMGVPQLMWRRTVDGHPRRPPYAAVQLEWRRSTSGDHASDR
jgi:hypothetical protein